MNEGPRLVIVGAKAWKPQVAAAFRGLDARQHELAAAVLRYLHDLHIGITAELAAGLGRLLGARPGQRQAAGPWTVVFERLADQFGSGGDDARSRRRSPRRRHTGLVPASAPFYAVARIAAPIVARASERLDEVFLFAADDEPDPKDFEARYLRYTAQLRHQLIALATDTGLSDVFWTDRAFTLSRLSRSGAPLGLPDVDPLSLARLLHLEPEVVGRPPRSRSVPRRMTTSPRYRPLLNRNEGGVDSIHQTRRMADLPSMLQSEFIHPRPLLFERLLESGYFALRRPPLREKHRDVLVAGILPPADPGADTERRRSLVKASWFDAMVRLSIWLQRAGLKRSEFLWIEADDYGRRRSSRCRLEDLGDAMALPDEPTSAYRKEFLAALGWLPAYLDHHAAGYWPDARMPSSTGTELGVFDWAAASWKAQGDPSRWQELGSPAREAHLDPQVWDTVLLMVFAPRRLETTTAFGALRHNFGLPAEPGYSITVTWMPNAIDDLSGDGWAVSAERQPTRPLLQAARGFDTRGDTAASAGDAQSLENRVAGALIGVWLKTILEQLLRDD